MLSQNELARQYDVSRSPVRDALRRLEQEGLVQLVPKVGALVKADDFSDAVDVTGNPQCPGRICCQAPRPFCDP